MEQHLGKEAATTTNPIALDARCVFSSCVHQYRWPSLHLIRCSSSLWRTHRPNAGKNEVKLAIQNLNEVLPWLQVRLYFLSDQPFHRCCAFSLRAQIDGFDIKTTDSNFNVARSLLMDLWQHLLSTFDVVPLFEFPSFAKVRLTFFIRLRSLPVNL